MLQSVNLSAGQASTNKENGKQQQKEKWKFQCENIYTQTSVFVCVWRSVCMSKQTRTVGHAQWVKFRFE